MGLEKIASFCFFLGFSSLVLVLVVIILPQWRVNSVVSSDSFVSAIRYKEGIWYRCAMYPSSGTFTCDMFDTSIIGLSGYLNACRALMIVSAILTLAGVFCSLLATRCITILQGESKEKRWGFIAGGICHFIAGTLTGICVSWYAAEIIWQYNDPDNKSEPIKYTLGACLYMGWVFMAISLLCGLLMSGCGFCDKPDESVYNPRGEDRNYSSTYHRRANDYDDNLRKHGHSYHEGRQMEEFV